MSRKGDCWDSENQASRAGASLSAAVLRAQVELDELDPWRDEMWLWYWRGPEVDPTMQSSA